MSSFNAQIVQFVKGLTVWLHERFSDPSLAAILLRDLNLKDKSINQADIDRIRELADQIEPDALSLDDVISNVFETTDALITLFKQFEDGSFTAWDILYRLCKLYSGEIIRVHNPMLDAIAQALQFISVDPRRLREFDPAVVTRISRGEDEPFGDTEALVHRFSSLGVVLGLVEELWGGADKVLDVYHGWEGDPHPDNDQDATPLADRALANAHTLVFKTESSLSPEAAVSIMAVSSNAGGPGLMISFGGELKYSERKDTIDYQLDMGAASALTLWLPFAGPSNFTAFGQDPNAYLSASIVARGPTNEEPAYRLGNVGESRLEIASMGAGLDLSFEEATARLFIRDAQLIINLSKGDGLLQSLGADEILIGFDIELLASNEAGLSIEGGLLTRAVMPVNNSVAGFLDIHAVSLQLSPLKDANADGASLVLGTSFTVQLGPFQAVVDHVGFEFDLAFREGNIGFADAITGLKGPEGIGLTLDAGCVRGGGYLRIDEAGDEYFGVLDLKFAKWGIKAIGTLKTQLPDGSPGFSLLLLVYGEARIPLGNEWYFEGIGGVLGLHHGADIEALKAGIPNGVFDDVLFPANPVADAPRIINRVRVIFPIRPHAFLLGFMFHMTWGNKPTVADVRFGMLMSVDNVLGGDDSAALDSLIMVGTIRIGLPDIKKSNVAKIICDFLGYLDFDSERFGFYARLRDSKIAGNLELTGSLLVRIDYGDNPSFLVAIGGFHPRFDDLPSDLPAKLDRVGLRFNIGIVKISARCYLAITSATVQFGAVVDISARIGSVSLAGSIGLDALIYYEPYFRFELDFVTGVAIKYRRWNLVSVDVRGTLSGPGLWHITGRLSFGVLWWDISKSFDEQWGDRPELDIPATSVAALLEAAFSDTQNWAVSLPKNSNSLVSLVGSAGTDGLLAHPLGQLQVNQKVAPLGVRLQKYGESSIRGATRFDVQGVMIGSVRHSTPPMLQEHLARANFIELSEEDLLTKPSFELFDTGVAVGDESYSVPAAAVDAPLDYETRQLLMPQRPRSTGRLQAVTSNVSGMLFASAKRAAAAGSAARSPIRRFNQLRPPHTESVTLERPRLAVINAQGNLHSELTLSAAAKTNVTLAEQQLSDNGIVDAQLVESLELA